MIGTLFKRLLLGLLFLALLALVLGGLFLVSWHFGWDFAAVIVPVAGIAALIVLGFALRRLWLWAGRHRYRHRILRNDPARLEEAGGPAGLVGAMQRAYGLGQETLGRHTLARPPLLLDLATAKASTGDLALCAGPVLEGESRAPLVWYPGQDCVVLRPTMSLPVLNGREEREAWEWLATELGEVSGKCPVDGFVVEVTAKELLAAEARDAHAAMATQDLHRQAGMLRSRMEEILAVHPAHVPLHLVVTGLEELPGFAPLLGRLGAAARQRTLGLSFEASEPGKAPTSIPALVRRVLDAGADQLADVLLSEACVGSPPSGRDLELPGRLEELSQGLVVFLETLLVPATAGRTPFLRGVHLTALHTGPASAAADTTPAASGVPPRFLPCFAQALFPRMGRDRALARSLREGDPTDRPRALAYAGYGLALLVLCGLFANAADDSLHTLQTARKLWADNESVGDARDVPSLLVQSRILDYLQTAERERVLPGFGLDPLPDEIDRFGAFFRTNMETRVLDVFTRTAALRAQGDQGVYVAMQRLLWLNETIDAARHGRRGERPFPLAAAPQTFGDDPWTPDFGRLFLTYVSVAPKNQLASLQDRLRLNLSGGNDGETVFNRLCDLVNGRSPEGEFPISRYWPDAPRGTGGFVSVPAVYTAEGYARIKEGMDQLARETGTDYADQPFWKAYLDRYGEVWRQFIDKTDRAWKLTDRVEALQRASENGRGLEDPHWRLVKDVPEQLAPLFAENRAPRWAEKLRLLRALLLSCDVRAATADGKPTPRGIVSVLWDASSLDRKDVEILLDEVRARHGVSFLADAVAALESYLAALNELADTLADGEGSLRLAAIEFGGRDYGDPQATAVAKAKAALRTLTSVLDGEEPARRGRRSYPAVQLAEGPLRFLSHAIVCNAATVLQHLWETEVLPQAMLLPDGEGVEALFGEKGLATAFVDRHARPFLTRTVGAYRPKTALGTTFPFGDDFLVFMQEGQTAQANPLRESYEVGVHTSTPSVNPDAAELMQFYELRLTCKKGVQTVRNANYPDDTTVSYEPANCSTAQLTMHFPSLVLTYDYQDFQQFLQEFSAGERVFTQTDFPEQAGRMEGLRIRRICLRVLTDDASSILSAYTGTIVLPNRIISIW